MCHGSCVEFGAISIAKEEIQGKRVLEVGACNVNGSLRRIVESLKPSEYVGIDIAKGPGVDIVCNAEDMVEKFGKESFDFVISTELLEHAEQWRKVVSNIKNVCKIDGFILITTRSKGFPYHGYPYDFWRYELEDMKEIFSDFEIVKLEKDAEAPGVFLKAKKPNGFKENDLKKTSLYSIVSNRRVKTISKKDFQSMYFRQLILKDKLKNFVLGVGRTVLSRM